MLMVNVLMVSSFAMAQGSKWITVEKVPGKKRIDITVNGKAFTRFLYPDSLEKPVLYPVFTTGGAEVTRGFPLQPKAGDPIDHPHHIGIWFNYENVNGLDFWNNSYAILQEKKNKYGWIRTDSILEMKSGKEAELTFHANWTNEAGETLMEETTRLTFNENKHCRIVDRKTELLAIKAITFNDVKDGLIGFRLAHALQIPNQKMADSIATGNYITETGMLGDSVWGTRAPWCKAFGKMGSDSVSVVIIDHPSNINYPTYWHARGYGLFAANPLGEKAFTNGKSTLGFQLKSGEVVTFRYRILIADGKRTISNSEINKLANAFSKKSRE